MSDIKCPFCQQELKELYINGNSVGFRCKNKNCPETNIMCGTKALWQELIHTKELLEIEDAEHSMCHTQMLKTTEKMERTRKALDVAVDALKKYKADSGNWWYGYEFQGHYEDYAGEYADKALEQITALEQKDK